MIIVKKECLNIVPTGYKLALGEMNQNNLNSLVDKYPDWFEKAKKKKAKDELGD
jgi:hypothetical protein